MIAVIVVLSVLAYVVIGAVGAGLVFRVKEGCSRCGTYTADRWFGCAPPHSPGGAMAFWPLYIVFGGLWYGVALPSWKNLKKIINFVAGREVA